MRDSFKTIEAYRHARAPVQWSLNPRSRRACRTRYEGDASTHQSPTVEVQPAEAHAVTNYAQPSQQGPPPQDHQAPSTDAMLAQIIQLMMQTQPQQQQQQYQQQLQLNTFMDQQAEFQGHVLTAQMQARILHKKKGDQVCKNSVHEVGGVSVHFLPILVAQC